MHLRKFRTNSFLVLKANSDQKQSVIFAFGTQKPGSSAVDATLAEHVDSGVLQLDLTKSSSTNGSTGGTSSSGADTSGVDSIPLSPYQRMIVAHATLCTVGFLFFLPAGALLARYSRTFTSTWFKGHWIAQFALGKYIPPYFCCVGSNHVLTAGPSIVIGIALGIQSVAEARATHLNDSHKVSICLSLSLRPISYLVESEIWCCDLYSLPSPMRSGCNHSLGQG